MIFAGTRAAGRLAGATAAAMGLDATHAGTGAARAICMSPLRISAIVAWSCARARSPRFCPAILERPCSTSPFASPSSTIPGWSALAVFICCIGRLFDRPDVRTGARHRPACSASAGPSSPRSRPARRSGAPISSPCSPIEAEGAGPPRSGADDRLPDRSPIVGTGIGFAVAAWRRSAAAAGRRRRDLRRSPSPRMHFHRHGGLSRRGHGRRGTRPMSSPPCCAPSSSRRAALHRARLARLGAIGSRSATGLIVDRDRHAAFHRR